MDRKVWARIVEDAIDRYRLAVAGERPTGPEPWPADATIEDHITEFAQQLADVGREQLG